MKTTVHAILCALLCTLVLGLALPAASQQTAPTAARQRTDADAWRRIINRGYQSMEAMDYTTGEQLFRDAVAYAEQHNLGSISIAESTNLLGWSLRSQRRYAEAEVAHRGALQMYRNTYPENHLAVLEAKVALGISLTGLGRYEEAESLLLDSLDVYNQQPEMTACLLTFPLDALTMLYRSNHQYSKGERVYTEVFALLTGNRGTPCEKFVLLLKNLAALYEDDNQWDRVEAIQRGRAGLALGMEGSRSKSYGDALFAVAETLEKRARRENAATAFAQAANIYRHLDPPDLDKLAESLERQEINLNVAGKSEEAKQLHPAVVAAIQQSQAHDPRSEMMSLRSRVLEARRNGQFDVAAQFLTRELAAAQKLGAREQMIALEDAAMIHREQQKLPEAEADMQRILAVSIKATGPASRSTADAHLGLARFYHASQRLPEAEESYTAALALYGEHDTEQVRGTLASLAYAYLQDGKLDRAELIYARMMKLAETTHDDAQLSVALQNMANLYQKSNRLADAEAALNRAMALALQLPKPLHRRWAPVAMSAASFYQQTGRPQQAEQLYLHVIAFLEQEVGADAAPLRLPLDKLIELLKSQGRLAEAAKYETRRDKLPPMPAYPGMAR